MFERCAGLMLVPVVYLRFAIAPLLLAWHGAVAIAVLGAPGARAAVQESSVPVAQVGERQTASDSDANSLIAVEDLIRFGELGDPRTFEWFADPTEPGIFSPDLKRLAVVVRRGNLRSNTNDAQLLVYRTEDLLRGGKPDVVAEFSTAGKYQPLAHVRWLADSKTLVFGGAAQDRVPQVYRSIVGTGKVEQLTFGSAALLWFDVDRSGRLVTVFREPQRRPPGQDIVCRTYGCRVTAATLYDAENGEVTMSPVLSVHDLQANVVQELPSPDEMDETLSGCTGKLEGGVSPDGRFGLRLCKTKHQPTWWNEYTADPWMHTLLGQGNTLAAERLVLVDLRSGNHIAVSEAPFPRYMTEPIWIDGGERVIVPAALRPLAGVFGAKRQEFSSTFIALIVEARTGKGLRIGTLPPGVAHVRSARWEDRIGTLTLYPEDGRRRPLAPVRYKRSGPDWVEVVGSISSDADSVRSARIEVRVKQSLNSPPVLLARDLHTGAEREVLDPNPWLRRKRLGRVEAVEWTSKDGRVWRGGLYLPPTYANGHRYPLVIQTHGFEAEKFSLNGIARNFAAQVLAAHGMVILQVAENISGVLGTPGEWTAVQAGYESAIDYLDARGVIDRGRVGIQGWSRTGPHVGYAVTQSSYRFAAAALTATADFGWMWYLSVGTPKDVANLYGAAPFGAGIELWQARSPTFNLHRIRTPTLMWGNGTGAVLWDWYAGLRALRKPVEYWVVPDGAHDVFQIGHRLTSNELVVDWFRFWLTGEQDPVERKRPQYQRWEELRLRVE